MKSKRDSLNAKPGIGRIFLTSFIVLGIFGNSPAFACGGILDVICNLNNGGLSPENIANQTRESVQNVANAINELQAGVLSGPALEQAIIASRDSARNGAMPIPANIRRMLTGYASQESMNRARFKIGDNGFFNLARLLEQGGFAVAVTLDDVIVFRGPSEASDPSVWAHELKHVDQYSSWGIHSFAVQYARNAGSVEGPAYEAGNSYWNWNRQQQMATQYQQFLQAGPTTSSPHMGVFCYTMAGKFGPGPIQPQGSPCWVNLPQGQFFGRVGP